jgi:hypothetical protein
MSDPSESEKFRRDATVVFRGTVGALFTLAGCIVYGGWWLAGWWGLAGGVILAGLVLAAGLTAAGLLYAMSQDGG